jgi:hypothetical protein
MSEKAGSIGQAVNQSVVSQAATPISYPLRHQSRSWRKLALRIAAVLFATHVAIHLYSANEEEGWLPGDRAGSKPGDIIWWKCENAQGGPLDCGTIVLVSFFRYHQYACAHRAYSVPKDYFNASAGTASIAVVRHRATAAAKKGTIMTNPGGPGGSGVSLIYRSGALISNLVGSHWDIIGFDPRGIGLTRYAPSPPLFRPRRR